MEEVAFIRSKQLKNKPGLNQLKLKLKLKLLRSLSLLEKKTPDEELLPHLHL